MREGDREDIFKVMAETGFKRPSSIGQLKLPGQGCWDFLAASHTELSPDLQLELWEES